MTADDSLRQIGRYDVVRLLGRGGMGSVYLARDPVIGRCVAIKLVDEDFGDPRARERVAREARAAGQLDHPNIVTIFDVGDHGPQLFIAMEYVDGPSLGAAAKDHHLDLDSRLRLMQEASTALAYAHRQGIIHLDIKPDNLMVDASGHVKILDFGIARLTNDPSTRTNGMAGTLRYMAPEQLAGEPPDNRSDVFALGCVLYEVLSGVPAFDGTVTDVVARIMAPAPPSIRAVIPEIDLELEALVGRMLAHTREDRPRDLDAVAGQLATIRRRLVVDVHQRSEAPTTGGPEKSPDARRPLARPLAVAPQARPRWLWAIPAVAVIGVVGAALALLPEALNDPPSSPAAQAPAAAPPQAAGSPPTRAQAASEARADSGVPQPAARTAEPALDFERRVRALFSTGDRRGVEAAIGVRDAASGTDHTQLVADLTTEAATTAERAAQRAAERGRAATDTADFRAAVGLLARANRATSDAEAMTKLWALVDATALFTRASTRVVIAEVAPTPPPPRSAPAATPAASLELQSTSTDSPAALPVKAPSPSELTRQVPIPPRADQRPPRSDGAAEEPLTARAATPPPVVAPSPAAADEAGIRAALHRYEMAYESLRADEVRDVFPSLTRAQVEQLTRDLKNMSSYRVDLSDVRIVFTERGADVTCVVAREFVPRVGGPQRNVTPTVFQLRRIGETWVIDRIAGG